MRLVSVQEAPKVGGSAAQPPSGAIAELSPELAATMETLQALLPQPGDLLPCEPVVILRQWPATSATPAPQVLRRLQQLVALGLVRQVILGCERYFCLAATAPAISSPPTETEPRQAAPAPAPPPAPAAKPPPDPEQERFQLQLAIDVEAERVLLFRVGIVLELLALLTLLRQILLTYLEP